MILKSEFNPQCLTYSQINMIFNARMYYRRLAAWTRAYLLSRYFGIGTEEELFSRLYLETIDVGNMLQIVFGRELSEQYSQLLSEFVITLRDLVNAQIEGNAEAVYRNVGRLYSIAEERAKFVDKMNPYWSKEEYENLFETYIQYVIEIANALATGDYSESIATYLLLADHADRMGDVFAEGLYDYITSGQPTPDQLENEVQCITFDQMSAIFGIRMFWFQLVIWIRNYMLSRYLGLGNVEEVRAQLMQVPVEFVNAMRAIFGDRVTEDYIQLFYTYIDLIDAFVTAQIEGNIDEINRITRLLYENANERAEVVTSFNPSFWDETEWRDRLYNNLRSTIDESTSFLMGDYARNIDIFGRLMDQAESTSNYLAEGIYNYFDFNQ